MISRLWKVMMTITILSGLFGCTGKTAESWQQLTMSRNHMNAAQCFHFRIFPNENRQMVLAGYCTADDGMIYSSEDGVVLSGEAMNQLRSLRLDELPNRKAKRFWLFDVSDETVEKLVLSYPNGKEKQKVLSDEVLDAIFGVLVQELSKKISSFEQISIHVSGMRVTAEYEIQDGEYVEISRYRILYVNGKAVRDLEKRVFCERKIILELLDTCGFLNWDGFFGSHPKDVLDGEMFVLSAVVNDGQIIHAEGSANYPKGYREFIRRLDQLLN